MALSEHLSRLKIRGQIDSGIIHTVQQVKSRLEQHWHADTATCQAELLLLHLACSLARIQRGGCASPLYQNLFEEIQSAVVFQQVFHIHTDLLQLMPFAIPAAEQSYFIANIYALLMDQSENIAAA